MKNFIKKIIAIIGLAALGTASLALAQYSTASGPAAADILPADIDSYYELNTDRQNPVGDFIVEQIRLALDEGNNAALITEIMAKIISDNTATYSLKMNPPRENQGISYPADPDMYITFRISQEDFDKLMMLDDAEVTAENYGTHTIYIVNGDQFYTLLDGLFVMTNTKENLQKAINRYNNNSSDKLNSVAAYNLTRNHFLTDGFLNMYLNPKQFLDQSSLTTSALPEIFNKEVLEALTAQGISIGQQTDGFSFEASLEANLAKLQELDLAFDKYNFVPSLYDTINGENLIYYMEISDLEQRFLDFLKSLNLDGRTLREYWAWKAQFKTDSGIDFDRDLLPLFSQNYMATIHKTDQIWPGITLTFNAGNNKNSAVAVISKFYEYLKKLIQAFNDTGFIIFDQTTIANTNFNSITINVKEAAAGSDLAELPREKTDFYLRMGVTNDGRIIISNVPDLGLLLQGRLTANADFAENFSNRNDTIEGLFYLNFDKLNEYMESLMTSTNADSEAQTAVSGLLEPWHSLYAKSFADADTAWVKGFINVDVADLYKYFEELKKRVSSIEKSYPVQEYLRGRSFCDVGTNDWFYIYIDNLSAKNIVSGYKDGCFRPNGPITRAEFIKIAIEAEKYLGRISLNEFSYADSGSNFSDIPADAWYTRYVNLAATKSIVMGFEDGTFRPNNPITRAEAVQILYNISRQLGAVNTLDQPLETIINFEDVRAGDWFLTPVAAAYHYGLVQGISPQRFEPNRSITRAEAAKIVKLYMDLEMGTVYPY